MEITSAQIVLPCDDLDATLDFFTEELGFRVEAISPADDPMAAVITAHGVRLRLDRRASGPTGTLRLACTSASDAATLTAPNGTVVELVEADTPLDVPPLVASLVVSRAADASEWNVGRARMEYRDLDTSRQGGRVIASHIRIPAGGPVADYVHFHKIRFQMIYCVRGWVKVVYEDQGEPFLLSAGDCVLQPPLIRHRVLESSAGAEVVEIGSPAVHDTFGDLEMTLPTAALDPRRDFGGQRFVRHVAADATWQPWRDAGFEVRDTGIADATRGVAAVRVVRSISGAATSWTPTGELLLLFVLSGAATIVVDGRNEELVGGDSVIVPADMPLALRAGAAGVELLEVTMPAAVES